MECEGEVEHNGGDVTNRQARSSLARGKGRANRRNRRRPRFVEREPFMLVKPFMSLISVEPREHLRDTVAQVGV